jgi:Na+-transporting methylmalonyl-CoA/oxaloacetate decarboxylase gamma subunit
MAESKVAALEGNDLADDYVRTHIPQGRWSDTWNLFKNNFLKFVIINVLTLVFFLPVIALVVFSNYSIELLGAYSPISANAGGIYPFAPSTVGLPQSITLFVDMYFYAAVIVAGLIAAIGISGACYSVKKMINTNGMFTVRGYFHGVKVCYLQTVLPVVVFSIFYFGCVVVNDWANLQIALGYNAGGPITAKVFIIIATVIIGIICAWVLAVGVSYKVGFKHWIKNSLVLMLGTVVQTIFMAAIALIPVWILMLGSLNTIVLYIAFALFIIMGFSFIILVWMAFAQWVFDMFITPAIEDEKKAAKAKMTPQELAAAKEQEEKAVAMELLAAGKSELIGKPIKPINDDISIAEVGLTFTRADLKRVEGDRKTMNDGVKKYYDDHINDTRYVEYNKLFAEREKALKVTDKKGKKAKISSDNLLK